MPAQPWANNAQLEFLKARRLDFATHQQEKTLSKFWSEIYRDFFEKWPDVASEREGLTDKEKKTLVSTEGFNEEQWITTRKKSIYNWYNNNGLKKKKRGCNSVKISIPQSASRLSTEAHLYSKRYYDTRVKSLVEAEIGDRKLKGKERIAIVNKHLNACFKNESAEIREEIKKAREEERAAKELAQGLDMAIVKAIDDLTPDQMLTAQSSLPDILAEFCDEMGKRTGWSFAMMAGGPDAGNKGEITTVSIHTGQDKYGQTFRRSYKEYKEHVELPFSNHLSSVYPKSVRDKFLLSGVRKSEPAPKTVAGASTDSSSGAASHSATSATADSSASPVPPPSTVVTPATAIAPAAAPAATGSPAVATPTPAPPIAPATAVTIPDPATPGPPKPVVRPDLPTTEHPTPSTVTPASLPIGNAFQVVLPLQDKENAMAFTSTASTDTPKFTGPFAKVNPINSSPGGDVLQPSSVGNQFSSTQTDVPGFDLEANELFGENDPFLNPITTMDWAKFSEFLRDFGYTKGTNTYTGPEGQNGTTTTPFSTNAPPTAGSDGQSFAEPSMNAPATAESNGQPSTAPSVAPSTSLPSSDVMIPQGPVPGAITPHLAIPVTMEGSFEGVQPTEPVDAPATPEESVSGLGGRGLGSRTRKPPMPKEVVPLVEKQLKEPEWIAVTHEYLKQDMNLGAWDELVGAWFNFETDSGALESPSQRLPAKGRPAILSKWLFNRRQFNSIPKIDDVEAFSIEWLTWWNSIQPKWRQVSISGTLPQPVHVAKNFEDLSSVKKSGPVGLVVAIISLKWWGGEGKNPEWVKAVEDVKAVLESMAQTLSAGLKRKAGAEAVVSDKRKKV